MARHTPTRTPGTQPARRQRTLGGGGPHPACGQHFLRRESTARRLVELTNIGPGDVVFEFGAGTGIITRHLVHRARKVIAYELDPQLAGELRKIARWVPSLRVMQEDCRSVSRFEPGSRLVANLPFGVTSDVMRNLTSPASPVARAVLVLQKEAANKFAGRPRATRFSLLAYPWFRIKIEADLPSHEFTPRPDVECAVISIDTRSTPLLERSAAGGYGSFIRRAHGSGSADIRSSLRAVWPRTRVRRVLDSVGVSPETPASLVPARDWLTMFMLAQS